VDPEQCLAREGPAEPVAQEAVKRADAERSDRQSLDALRTKGLLEFRRLRFVDNSPGEEHEYTVPAQPSQRERKRARRRWVEPLDVVNGNQNRLPFTETLQHLAHRYGKGAAIDGIT
jgi:hypothetical protein